MNSDQKNLQGNYDVVNVYFSHHCNDTLINMNYELFILNYDKIECGSFGVKNNITVPILAMKNSPNSRYSSPKVINKDNFEMKSNYSFTELASFEKAKTIFSISNASLLFKTVAESLTCSDGKHVELGQPIDTCEPTKYLLSPANIYEQQCIDIFDNHIIVSVDCQKKFNSSFIPVLDGIKQDPMELIKDQTPFFSCCKGKNYVFQFYGNCNIKNLNNIIEHTHFEKGKCDNIRNILVNTGYYMNRACLYKVSFDSECNNKDIKLPTCRRVQCDKLTH